MYGSKISINAYGITCECCEKDNFTLTTYTDADWVGCIDGRKSASGRSLFLGNKLLSWHEKKHESISLSTAEAKYIAVVSCCTQVLWMKQILKDLKVEFSKPISILCENTSAINLSKNPIMHSRTKHISIKYHFLKKNIEDNEVKL